MIEVFVHVSVNFHVCCSLCQTFQLGFSLAENDRNIMINPKPTKELIKIDWF